jgi:hypothetical protein
MKLRSETWILLADSRRGRLLRCGLTPRGTCGAEECDAVTSIWSGRDHGRGRPLWKTAARTFGIEDDRKAETAHRFAKQLAAWLRYKVVEHGIGHVHVVGPARFLAALRHVLPPTLAGRLTLRPGEMIRFPAGTLASHPAIRRLVETSAEVRPEPVAGLRQPA